MADFPDIYADGFSLSAGPYGVSLTLTLSQPTGEPGPHEEPTDRVARLRFGRELARTLADALNQMLAVSGQGATGSASVRH